MEVLAEVPRTLSASNRVDRYAKWRKLFHEWIIIQWKNVARAHSLLWARHPGPCVSYKWIISLHWQIIGILGRDNWRFMFELLFYYFLIAFPWRKFISSQNHNSLLWNIGITNLPTQICCKDKISFTFSLNQYFYPTLTRHHIFEIHTLKNGFFHFTEGD